MLVTLVDIYRNRTVPKIIIGDAMVISGAFSPRAAGDDRQFEMEKSTLLDRLARDGRAELDGFILLPVADDPR